MSKSLRPEVALAVLEVAFQQVGEAIGNQEQQINELTHGCDCFVDQQRELIEQLTGHYPAPNDSLAYHDIIEQRIRELLTERKARKQDIVLMVQAGDRMADRLQFVDGQLGVEWQNVRVPIPDETLRGVDTGVQTATEAHYAGQLTAKDTEIAELTDQVEKFTKEMQHKAGRIAGLEDTMESLRDDLLAKNKRVTEQRDLVEELVRDRALLARVMSVDPDRDEISGETIQQRMLNRVRKMDADKDTQLVIVRLASLLGVERDEDAITREIRMLQRMAELKSPEAVAGQLIKEDDAKKLGVTLSVHQYKPAHTEVEGADCSECELPPDHPIHDHPGA